MPPESPQQTGGPGQVFGAPKGRGWILTLQGPGGGDKPIEGLLRDVAVALAESLPGSWGWFGWEPYELHLPAGWEPGDPDPFATHWHEVRLFHREVELRLSRFVGGALLSVLTENEALVRHVRELASPRDGWTPLPSTSPFFWVVAGQVLLAGRPPRRDSTWQLGGTPALLDVAYPRLLTYAGPGLSNNLSRRGVKALVFYYLDEAYRWKATRYRALRTIAEPGEGGAP